AGGRVADLERLGYGGSDPAFLDVRARGLAGRRLELRAEPRRGQLVQAHHARPLALVLARALDRLARALTLGQLDAGSTGEVAHHLDERLALDLAEEAVHVARLSTSEAVEELPLRVHVERGALLLVKRTQPFVVDAGPLERNVLADDLHDVRALADLGDLVVRNQTQAKVSSTS